MISRRRFLVGSGSLIALQALPLITKINNATAAGKKWSIDISQYPLILLPREHGQLTKDLKTIVRRYPSREHCMQMTAFINNNEALLVIANDPKAGVSDWRISPRRELEITFYGDVPEVKVITTSPTLEAIANAYRDWANTQFWMNRIRPISNKLDFISVASSSSVKVEMNNINKIKSIYKRNIGIWLTQWRKYPFDRMYPDYTPKEPHEFSKLLYFLKSNNIDAFPYVNSMLWDVNNNGFKELGKKVAVKNIDGSDVLYNKKLSFLHYACPSSQEWRNHLLTSILNIVDSQGNQSSGIYLDMLAAATPTLCWSEKHGHMPGDAYCWVNGMLDLIQNLNGKVMVEGCAEVYLGGVDHMLMHLYTDRPDAAPLWQAVYGDKMNAVGWSIPKDITKLKFQSTLSRSKSFGVSGSASPWMTTLPESELIKRKLITP